MDLMNTWGLYAFAVLVPIIILYLLRPKPKDMRIPSLMFITEIQQRKRFRSFLKRIILDPILILQILAITLLVLAIADPFYLAKETKIVDREIAIVIDASASMQAGSPSRFAQAKDTALSIVSDLKASDKVSVILAENIPVVALRQGDKARAESIIGGLGPKATPTGVGAGIMLAADILEDSEVEKKIYAISDFSNFQGTDPLAAQKSASTKGISTELIKVGKDGENIGIISARSGRELDKCFMEALAKNYGQSDKSVSVSLSLDGQKAGSLEKPIAPGSAEVFYLSTACSSAEHTIAASLNVADALSADDAAYAIIPKAAEYKVLLIREESSDEHIKYALESIGGVTVTQAYPPVYPQSYSEYDTVIFQEAKLQNILPGTFHEIKDFVEKGGNLVVLGFEGLVGASSEGLADILPVEPIGVSKAGGNPTMVFEHQILRDINIAEVKISEYVTADAKPGSITLAEVMSNPVITLWEAGNGEVVYLAISSSGNWSDFYVKPSFPVFWHRMLLWLNRDESISRVVNFKTGEQLPVLSNQSVTVKKPSGEKIRGMDILLDEAGFYNVEGSDKRVAASLLNEMESDISSGAGAESADIQGEYAKQSMEEEVTKELYWALALAALCLIVIEWFYYRRRGSL